MRDGATVAIKIIDLTKVEDISVITNEIAVMANYSHIPQLCEYYGSESYDDQLWVS